MIVPARMEARGKLLGLAGTFLNNSPPVPTRVNSFAGSVNLAIAAPQEVGRDNQFAAQAILSQMLSNPSDADTMAASPAAQNVRCVIFLLDSRRLWSRFTHALTLVACMDGRTVVAVPSPERCCECQSCRRQYHSGTYQ